jgi:urea transporter
MAALGDWWDRLAAGNGFIEFIDACLRGVSQVMLQNNPLSGLVILIGIGWGAFDTGQPRVLGGAVVGLLVGTATALVLHADRSSLRQGLYGFSPLLTGIGVSTFLGAQALVWIYLIAGAAATTVVTLALTTVFNTWGVPPFTFPFVLVTWFLLMGAYQFAAYHVRTPSRPALPGTPEAVASYSGKAWLGMLEGVAQVYLIGSWISGAIILLGLAINSRWSAFFAVLGAVTATVIAIWFGAGAKNAEAGIWAFNGVLTAIALGSVLYRPSAEVAVYALFGVAFTVIVQAGLSTILAPLGVPTLTAPFVFATWLFLLPKRHFAPIWQHRPIGDRIFSDLRPSTGDRK